MAATAAKVAMVATEQETLHLGVMVITRVETAATAVTVVLV